MGWSPWYYGILKLHEVVYGGDGEGADMGSCDDAVTAPEQGSRDVSQIAPAWFRYGSQYLFLGTKRLRKRCLSTVPGAGFYDVFRGVKGKTFLPLKGKTRLPLDIFSYSHSIVATGLGDRS